MRPKTCALSGVFSGMGHRPQLTSTCSRMACARCSHSDFVLMSGKVRRVFSVFTVAARWSFSGNAGSAARIVTSVAASKARVAIVFMEWRDGKKTNSKSQIPKSK